MNLFEIATRRKYRFATNKGSLSVEDLWDLSSTQLDAIYRAMTKELREQGGESLMQKDNDNTVLTDKIEIIKHIFLVKQEEAAARRAAEENRNKRQRIMEILEQKRDASLQNMSEEDLQKMLNDLQ